MKAGLGLLAKRTILSRGQATFIKLFFFYWITFIKNYNMCLKKLCKSDRKQMKLRCSQTFLSLEKEQRCWLISDFEKYTIFKSQGWWSYLPHEIGKSKHSLANLLHPTYWSPNQVSWKPRQGFHAGWPAETGLRRSGPSAEGRQEDSGLTAASSTQSSVLGWISESPGKPQRCFWGGENTKN